MVLGQKDIGCKVAVTKRLLLTKLATFGLRFINNLYFKWDSFFSGKLSNGSGGGKRYRAAAVQNTQLCNEALPARYGEHEWIFLLSFVLGACAAFNLNVSTYKPNLIILRTACG